MSAALLLLILGAVTGLPADTCRFRSLRPAYAHNDYYNRRPFLDAIGAGFRGAEVDLFFRNGDLHVGHHPRELSRSATLDQVYLSPMAARLDECGSLLTDGQKFWLFLELKERDGAAFRELERQLGAARQLLDEGPIQVVLVDGGRGMLGTGRTISQSSGPSSTTGIPWWRELRPSGW